MALGVIVITGSGLALGGRITLVLNVTLQGQTVSSLCHMEGTGELGALETKPLCAFPGVLEAVERPGRTGGWSGGCRARGCSPESEQRRDFCLPKSLRLDRTTGDLHQ